MSFSLDKLRSDFLVGSGTDILQGHVAAYLAQIDAVGDPSSKAGVLVAEADPVLYVAAFLAALERKVPVILGNAHWGETEWASFDRQFSPILAFGRALNPKQVPTPTAFSDADSDLILIPTGGSSAEALKFAKHQWSSIRHQSQMTQAFLNTGAVNSICALPLFHVSGIMQIVRALITGGQVLLTNLKSTEREEFPIELKEYCLSLVPTQLRRLLDDGAFIEQLTNLKCIFVGGAKVDAGLLERSIALKLPIVTCYGMTETAGLVAVEDYRVQESSFNNRNHLLPDVRIGFEPSEGYERIRVFSKSLFQGYWGGPEFEPMEGFLTSDYGSLSPEGGLIIQGRLDRVINSGGEKVCAQEVENALLATGKIASAIVVGQHSLDWGELIVAIVIPFGGLIRDFNHEHISVLLKGTLANYKHPKKYIAVKKLPTLSNGKPDKNAITQLLEAL